MSLRGAKRLGSATLLFLCASLALGQSMPAKTPRPAAPAAPEIGSKAAPTRLDILRAGLTEVCSRHRAVERCYLVLAQGKNQGQAGIWFVPIFDGKVDDTALGEAQQVYMKVAPGMGQLPMVLLSRLEWRKKMAGVTPIYVRQGPP